MKTVGIMGGAFDPLHVGHITVGRMALDYVDEVWLMPCYSHAYGKNMRPAEFRLGQCRLAVENEPRMLASNFEIVRKLQGITCETFFALRQEYHPVQFSLIIGQDNADEIEKWEYYEQLINEFRCIVIGRGTAKVPENAWYKKEPHVYMPTPGSLITGMNSTELRTKLFNGDKGIKQDFPSEAVYNAIVASGLYAV